MKYVHQPKVDRDVARRHRRDVDAVNAWIDALKGTVVAVEIHQSGQARPYADGVTAGLLHLHQPNCWTTNAPGVRTITRPQAKALLEILCHGGNALPEPPDCGTFEERLETLEPGADPCGLGSAYDEKTCGGRYHCWRFVIRSPYCD